MDQSASDEDLIKRIAAKDQLAIRSLYGRHNVRVFRFIVRLVRNEAIAEEIANEVFLDVWRRATKFAHRSTVSTWMLAIARNKAISVLRKRAEDQLDERTAEALEDDGDTPEDIAQKMSKSEQIRTCIGQLSQQHREVLDLVYYHEKDVREVSEIIGIPESTVKTRMFYARKQLSTVLMEHGIDRGWP